MVQSHSHSSYPSPGLSTAGLSTVVASDPEMVCTYASIPLKHTARCGHRHWALIYTKMQIRVFNRKCISKILEFWARTGVFIYKHPEVWGLTCSPLQVKGRSGPKAWKLFPLLFFPVWLLPANQALGNTVIFPFIHETDFITKSLRPTWNAPWSFEQS